MKKVYIGRPGSGKTTKLLEDLKLAITDKKIDDNSTILYVMDSEKELFKALLPNAICIANRDFGYLGGEYETLVVDTSLSPDLLLKLNGNLPENVFWTFQSALELESIMQSTNAAAKELLYKMNEEIAQEAKCIVLDIVLW